MGSAFCMKFIRWIWITAKYAFYKVSNVWWIMIYWSYNILSLSETGPRGPLLLWPWSPILTLWHRIIIICWSGWWNILHDSVLWKFFLYAYETLIYFLSSIFSRFQFSDHFLVLSSLLETVITHCGVWDYSVKFKMNITSYFKCTAFNEWLNN